jgi:hypothetical protein
MPNFKLNLSDDFREETPAEKRYNANLKKFSNFIQKLKNVPKYKKGRKKGQFIKKYQNCPIKVDEGKGKSGASGELNIQTGKKFLYRESQLIRKNILTSKFVVMNTNLFESFYFPRLKNYCKQIRNYVNRSSKIFPNNFLKIKNCKYCLHSYDNEKLTISYDMENASYKKKNTDNFADDVKKGIYDYKQLGSLFCQIYFISVVSNRKGLFHNDLKPANIVINKAKKNFIYSGLGNIKINIKKGDIIPIIVDYDLISFKSLIDHPVSSGTSYDFNFFKVKQKSKAGDPKHLFLDENLPEFDKRINSKKLKLIFGEFLNVK